MKQATTEVLKKVGLNPDDFLLMAKTCDNIKIKNKKTGKLLDIRW